jgi:DHA1 family inner membrane transport protein
MLAGFGLAGIVGNWIAGHGADHDALAATAVVALTLAVAMAAIGLVTHAPILLMIVIALWGAAHMAAFVVSQVHVMQAGRAAPAFAMSLNIAVCNLGIALGALVGGWIADGYGVENAGYGGGIVGTIAGLIGIAMIAARTRR